ncbi:glycosyltransferase [Polynucleobacter sp. 80A-SIGWE]|uniref:glycosyltransferase n=1 Tax=Polynucleobacter sp. 80A-SIGWE TaxID=2689100 RepID=UPI001C20F3CE|nr:glycosyltransferase [Polynucleobacter sp. 80A-SIGWE]
MYAAPYLTVHLFPENTKGLSEIYNSVIEKSIGNAPSMMVFAHDDIHILDFCWMQAIFNGLNIYGIVGVVGNKRRVPLQASWAFIDSQLNWDESANLSGIIGHGSGFPPENFSFFGPPFQEVKLLDGVLLAAFSETLISKSLRFDENFKFHFYDMDFCRQAELRGVSMGTIPLSLVHESGGNFGSESWSAAYNDYVKKWGE